MIEIIVGTGKDYKDIQQKIQDTPEQAKKILVQSLNATAKQSLEWLSDFASKKYDVQKNVFQKGKGKNAEVKIKNATKAKLESAVTFKGKKLSLIKYKTDPNIPTPTNLPDVVRGHVLRQSGLRPIINKYGKKAFIIQFKSGHFDIVARVSGKRYPIKTIYSPAIPQLVGAKRVVIDVHPKIGVQLDNEINKRIDKFLKKKGK